MPVESRRGDEIEDRLHGRGFVRRQIIGLDEVEEDLDDRTNARGRNVASLDVRGTDGDCENAAAAHAPFCTVSIIPGTLHPDSRRANEKPGV
jgi:hypothetical protein